MRTAKQALDALPDSIRVGNLDVYIEVAPFVINGDTVCLGTYGRDAARIELWDRMSSSQVVVETFVHEVLHAIWDCAKIEDGDNEERTVSVLAKQLVALQRENPWLTKWIDRYS